MKKGDQASPSITLAGRALLVKMLITLEQRYTLGSNFEYFFFAFLFFFIIYFFIFFIFCEYLYSFNIVQLLDEASSSIILAD